MPKKTLVALILVSLSLCLGIYSAYSREKVEEKDQQVNNQATKETNKNSKEDLYSKVELFSYALTTIQSEYVDEKTPKDMIYGSLKGLLSSLDPHSQFLDPDDYKELKTETQGKFGGL